MIGNVSGSEIGLKAKNAVDFFVYFVQVRRFSLKQMK